MFSLVSISQVIGQEGLVFCTSQEIDRKYHLWNIQSCVDSAQLGSNSCSRQLVSPTFYLSWPVVIKNCVSAF